jgi:thiol-disulfide isomerase/thioredoxin
MKQTIITIMLALVCLAACKTENRYTISADCTALAEAVAKEGASIDSFYLEDLANGKLITRKQAFVDNKIVLSGIVEEPCIAYLQLQESIPGGVRTESFPLFLEPGEIEVTLNENISTAAGTPLNDVFFGAVREIGDALLSRDYDKARKCQCEYIFQHQDDLTAVLMLNAMGQTTTEEAKEVLMLIGECSEAVQQHPVVVQRAKAANTLIERPDEGNMFKDFAVEYNGKTTRFSDYVGKGQYILVDFWASWCGPCRAEIPNLIKAYNKYKEKGLVVLGVAVNDKPEDTRKAIENEKIPYPQVFNSQQIATDLYGITGIPHIILFAPDGKILKRGLRGENIEKELEKIFGE